MTPAIQTIYTAQERAVMFFRHVKKDLGIPSTRKTVALVGRVLSHLIRGMTVQQTSTLLNQLPDLFEILLLKDWKYNNADHKSYSHLDEFVDRIYEEDQKLHKSVFASEVEALGIVIVILRRLDKYLNLFSYNILKESWVEELRQIPVEDAA